LKGLDAFKAHFEGFAHNYVLIGGAACEIVMEEVGLDFRATKDLDIVILVEALDAAFGERFWAFVEAGGYQQRERSSGKKEFYRFQRPSNGDYPAMLELFARAPDAITPAADSMLTPLPVDEDIASLSAILLDDVYYHALVENIWLSTIRRCRRRAATRSGWRRNTHLLVDPIPLREARDRSLRSL
jgi:hypothetical protein